MSTMLVKIASYTTVLLYYSRQSMREGVLPLNIVVSLFYLALTAVIALVLKKSSRPVRLPQGVKEADEGWREKVDLRKVLALSWVKKYTAIGCIFNQDKKYLLKEFVFVGAYAVACLQINHIILWPVTFSLLLLPLHFILYDVILKKINFLKVSQAQTHNTSRKQRIGALKNQGQSQIEIQSVNIDAIPAASVEPIQGMQEGAKAKENGKMDRCKFQVVSNSLIGIASIVLLMETVMMLTNSISNSGQINISSVLIIICIDQFAIRTGTGLLLFATITVAQKVVSEPIMDNLFVSALCQEELREAISVYVKEKRKKEQEMTASPPRKKLESPSRVPKATGSDQPTYLNLINLQPTRRKTENGEEEDGSGLEQIYLTTLEQEMFGDSEQQRGGSSTRRKTNKENKEHSYLSAVQKFTIEQEDHSEDQETKQDPLQECHLNHIDPFNYHLSPNNYKPQFSPAIYTKRRGPIKKKNKRVLNLTGSSPYLEYLPNMLKNVEKFKTIPVHKEPRVL